MKWSTNPSPLSDRTRRAVQEYTALNTLTTAMEHLHAGTFDDLDVALLEAAMACDEGFRIRLNCPLARRMQAVNMLRAVGVTGTLRRRLARRTPT